MHPERVQGELKRVVESLREKIDEYRAFLGKPPVGLLRANLTLPHGSKSLRVTHSYNMENDADDKLLLDKRGPGAGAAIRLRKAVIVKLGAAIPAGRVDYMTKYERAQIRSDLIYAVCIPIFKDVSAWRKEAAKRPQPIGVLCLDSDEDLSEDMKANKRASWLVSQSHPLSDIVSELNQMER